MRLQEKVALLLIAVVFLNKAECSVPLPQSLKNNPVEKYFTKPKYGKSHSLSRYGYEDRQKSHRFQEDFQRQNIYKSYNFPEVDYPSDNSPKVSIYGLNSEYDNSGKTSSIDALSDSALLNNLRKEKRRKRKNKQIEKSYTRDDIPQATVPESFHNQEPSFYLTEMGLFPEVQYPLTATETWTPNYWNSLPSNKDDPYSKDDLIYQNKKKDKKVESFIQQSAVKRNNGMIATVKKLKEQIPKVDVVNTVPDVKNDEKFTKTKRLQKLDPTLVKVIENKKIDEKSPKEEINNYSGMPSELLKKKVKSMKNIPSEERLSTRKKPNSSKKSILAERTTLLRSYPYPKKASQSSIPEVLSTDDLIGDDYLVNASKRENSSKAIHNDTIVQYSMSNNTIDSLVSDITLTDATNESVIESFPAYPIALNALQSDEIKELTLAPVESNAVTKNSIQVAPEPIISEALADNLREIISKPSSSHSLVNDLREVIRLLTVWNLKIDDSGEIIHETIGNNTNAYNLTESVSIIGNASNEKFIALIPTPSNIPTDDWTDTIPITESSDTYTDDSKLLIGLDSASGVISTPTPLDEFDETILKPILTHTSRGLSESIFVDDINEVVFEPTLTQNLSELKPKSLLTGSLANFNPVHSLNNDFTYHLGKILEPTWTDDASSGVSQVSESTLTEGLGKVTLKTANVDNVINNPLSESQIIDPSQIIPEPLIESIAMYGLYDKDELAENPKIDSFNSILDFFTDNDDIILLDKPTNDTMKLKTGNATKHIDLTEKTMVGYITNTTSNIRDTISEKHKFDTIEILSDSIDDNDSDILVKSCIPDSRDFFLNKAKCHSTLVKSPSSYFNQTFSNSAVNDYDTHVGNQTIQAWSSGFTSTFMNSDIVSSLAHEYPISLVLTNMQEPDTMTNKTTFREFDTEPSIINTFSGDSNVNFVVDKADQKFTNKLTTVIINGSVTDMPHLAAISKYYSIPEDPRETDVIYNDGLPGDLSETISGSVILESVNGSSKNILIVPEFNLRSSNEIITDSKVNDTLADELSVVKSSSEFVSTFTFDDLVLSLAEENETELSSFLSSYMPSPERIPSVFNETETHANFSEDLCPIIEDSSFKNQCYVINEHKDFNSSNNPVYLQTGKLKPNVQDTLGSFPKIPSNTYLSELMMGNINSEHTIGTTEAPDKLVYRHITNPYENDTSLANIETRGFSDYILSPEDYDDINSDFFDKTLSFNKNNLTLSELEDNSAPDFSSYYLIPKQDSSENLIDYNLTDSILWLKEKSSDYYDFYSLPADRISSKSGVDIATKTSDTDIAPDEYTDVQVPDQSVIDTHDASVPDIVTLDGSSGYTQFKQYTTDSYETSIVNFSNTSNHTDLVQNISDMDSSNETTNQFESDLTSHQYINNPVESNTNISNSTELAQDVTGFNRISSKSTVDIETGTSGTNIASDEYIDVQVPDNSVIDTHDASDSDIVTLDESSGSTQFKQYTADSYEASIDNVSNTSNRNDLLQNISDTDSSNETSNQFESDLTSHQYIDNPVESNTNISNSTELAQDVTGFNRISSKSTVDIATETSDTDIASDEYIDVQVPDNSVTDTHDASVPDILILDESSGLTQFKQYATDSYENSIFNFSNTSNHADLVQNISDMDSSNETTNQFESDLTSHQYIDIPVESNTNISNSTELAQDITGFNRISSQSAVNVATETSDTDIASDEYTDEQVPDQSVIDTHDASVPDIVTLDGSSGYTQFKQYTTDSYETSIDNVSNTSNRNDLLQKISDTDSSNETSNQFESDLTSHQYIDNPVESNTNISYSTELAQDVTGFNRISSKSTDDIATETSDTDIASDEYIDVQVPDNSVIDTHDASVPDILILDESSGLTQFKQYATDSYETSIFNFSNTSNHTDLVQNISDMDSSNETTNQFEGDLTSHHYIDIPVESNTNISNSTELAQDVTGFNRISSQSAVNVATETSDTDIASDEYTDVQVPDQSVIDTHDASVPDILILDESSGLTQFKQYATDSYETSIFNFSNTSNHTDLVQNISDMDSSNETTNQFESDLTSHQYIDIPVESNTNISNATELAQDVTGFNRISSKSTVNIATETSDTDRASDEYTDVQVPDQSVVDTRDESVPDIVTLDESSGLPQFKKYATDSYETSIDIVSNTRNHTDLVQSNISDTDSSNETTNQFERDRVTATFDADIVTEKVDADIYNVFERGTVMLDKS